LFFLSYKFNEELFILFFIGVFCLFRVLVYRGLLLGCAGTSKYRLLGALRAILQSLRFEVCFIFLIFSIIFFQDSIVLDGIGAFKIRGFIINLLVLNSLLLILVVEGNRPPFDFMEGESELVSGFNVEYFRSFFAFIFIGEYFFILVFGMFFIA